MANAKRKTATQEQHIPEGAMAQTSAPATVTPAPSKAEASNVVRHPAILVYDGSKNPINIGDTKPVTGADLTQAGNALKHLAYNVMQSNVSTELFNKDAAFWMNRALKDAKGSFFVLAAVKGANGKSAAEVIRDRWNAECKAKSENPKARIAQVSLSGLAKLFRKARDGAAGQSPYGRMKDAYLTFIEQVNAICHAKGVNKDRKLAQIAEKCSEAQATLEGKDE